MFHFLEVGAFTKSTKVSINTYQDYRGCCWKGDDDHYHINNYRADEAGTGKITHLIFKVEIMVPTLSGFSSSGNYDRKSVQGYFHNTAPYSYSTELY